MSEDVMATKGDDAPRSMTGLDWFEAAPMRAVFAALNKGGHEARAVGGSVPDVESTGLKV